MLFGLKRALPGLGMPPAAEVLTLLTVATLFVWRFWWRCSSGHCGALFLVGVIWVAGLVKVAMSTRWAAEGFALATIS